MSQIGFRVGSTECMVREQGVLMYHAKVDPWSLRVAVLLLGIAVGQLSLSSMLSAQDSIPERKVESKAEAQTLAANPAAGVETCDAPTEATWRAAEPNQLIDAGAYTIRAPARSNWEVRVSADQQLVHFKRRSSIIAGSQMHGILVCRRTVPSEMIGLSESVLAESAAVNLLEASVTDIRRIAASVSKVKTKHHVMSIQGRTVYGLESEFAYMMSDLTIFQFRGLTIVIVPQLSDGSRVWYIVDGDRITAGGAGFIKWKPDAEELQAVLLSMAETSPRVVP
ncbi:MAG TPA: hypothetical protein VKP10_13160 [Gemmatimonadales bacterium]|nr:hypothetical protein [Gemmatimonadales bacterium]